MSHLRAVILDWAGTTVDFGSLAPVRTLERVFREHGIAVREEDARRDMGIAKRDHIRNLLGRIGENASEERVDDLYAAFIPKQLEVLESYSAVIPGVVETAHALRSRGLMIGSTTGYTRAMLDLLVSSANEQGYTPDCSLSPEEAGAGRPHPFMIYEAAVRMGVYPLWAVVKVGDTPSDIEEGRNAGTWTVGVAATGNQVGLSYSDFTALDSHDRDSLVRRAHQELREAGADYVIDAVSKLLPVLDEIEQKLEAGKRPWK